MEKRETQPVHIGIIMDGNGRWAKQNGLPRNLGHKKGAETFEKISRYCRDIGVKWLTVYAFSTENWKRPPEEVSALMSLMRQYLKRMDTALGEQIAVRFIGDRGPLDDDLVKLIEKAEAAPIKDPKLTVQIALNYGGRDEIIHAARKAASDAVNGIIAPEQIDERALSDRMYSPDAPDPDLIIRPSGEQRISNFLLWQCAYSEFVCMDVLWPDFTPEHLEAALDEYERRNRRFGGI